MSSLRLKPNLIDVLLNLLWVVFNLYKKWQYLFEGFLCWAHQYRIFHYENLANYWGHPWLLVPSTKEMMANKDNSMVKSLWQSFSILPTHYDHLRIFIKKHIRVSPQVKKLLFLRAFLGDFYCAARVERGHVCFMNF